MAPLKINDLKDSTIYSIPETKDMCSAINVTELSISDLKHLLNGKPLLDLSDAEYIHAIKLSNEILTFLNKSN